METFAGENQLKAILAKSPEELNANDIAILKVRIKYIGPKSREKFKEVLSASTPTPETEENINAGDPFSGGEPQDIEPEVQEEKKAKRKTKKADKPVVEKHEDKVEPVEDDEDDDDEEDEE